MLFKCVLHQFEAMLRSYQLTYDDLQYIYYQMSTNKSPFTSRYTRKENYQSLNFPAAGHSLSPHPHPFSNPHEHSAIKKSIQQKQIEDLQQKVDLILQHNDKLAAENSQLKRRLTEADMIGASSLQKERFSKYQIAEENEYTVRKISSELIIKTRQLQQAFTELQTFKEIARKEGDSMREIINGLTLTNEALKLQNGKLSQDFIKVRQSVQSESRLTLKQAQKKKHEEAARVQKQRGEELDRQKVYHTKLVEELTKNFEEERNDWQNRKTSLINRLQQTHTKEINELRQQMISQFNQQMQRLEQDVSERCKNERDKADKFVKQFMDSFGPNNDAETQGLKHQIKILQESLESRKLLIDELTSNQMNREDFKSSFDEVIALRERLKEQIEHLTRENQLLKIKSAEQYEKDLKEMVQIYQDKIQVLSTQVRNQSDQNDRLRHNYEDEVVTKIKQRRNWEIEVTQLKNLIRKLKVELRGIQDQFKLSIEGVRDQNATFSMTLMKSMIQDREKASFFQEENRKLRLMYQKHQAEVKVEKKQAQEKVKYFESKIEHLKKLIQQQKDDVNKKEALLDKKFEEREFNLRESIRKEREHVQETISMAEEQKQKLVKDYFDCKQQCMEHELDLKQAKAEIDQLTSKIKENEEHIERLRMELEMAGVDDTDKNATLNHWKEHYEGIILKLEGDKKQLKALIEGQNQKIEQLIYRYRLLEEELKKATISMTKRGDLDRKVIKLGLDQNLVKNMSELWGRKAQHQNP